MTIKTISDSERDPSQSVQGAQSPTQAPVDRLGELLPAEALEDALKGLEPEEITGPGGLLTQLAGRVIETALGTELTEHLGHPSGGCRRAPTFATAITASRSVVTRSRGSPTPLEDVIAWRTRPLEAVYPIVYFDALMVKVREDRSVHNRACYLALGVTCDGDREVLGIWWQETEGAKFWLSVLNDLRRRGVQDVLIACVDGLKGFPEAIEATFPQTWVQTCIVHLIRASLRYVNYRDRKKVASALRPIYTAPNAEQALTELERFDTDWGQRYPATVGAWRASWEHVIPFLSLPDELRRAVYTTNTIEGLHRQIRKAIKTRGHFPDEQAATKLTYLAIMRANAKWQKNRTWTAPRAALKIHFGDRFPG